MLLLELERRDGPRMRQDQQLVTWPLHLQSVLTLRSFPGCTANRVLLETPDARTPVIWAEARGGSLAGASSVSM